MAADSYGPKNEPQFAGSGPSADAEDLTLLGAFAAQVGNRMVGTRAQRLALDATERYVGLEFQETDFNGTPWIWKSSGWVVNWVDTGWLNINLSTGYEASNTNVPRARVLNGVLYLAGFLDRVAGADMFGVLPSACRPTREYAFLTAGRTSATLRRVLVDVNGNMTLAEGGAFQFLSLAHSHPQTSI